MFCACLSIIICLFILICGATVSIIDVRRYDFGLYYALLAIVGLTAAVAVCVVRPRRGCCTRDPHWYTKFCERLNACLIAEQQRVKAYSEGNTYSMAGAEDGVGGERRSGASSNITRQQRATLVMLRPAMELMQHMLHGLVNREDDEHKDEDDTSEATGEMDEEARNRRRSKKKKKKKKFLLPANDVCLYTILETSTVAPTEATSVVTVHEGNSQLLNDSVPNSPAALLPSSSTLAPRQQLIYSQRKHLLNQVGNDSPRLKGLDTPVFNFQRHDVLSETVDEERFSETRCSSTHEG